MAQQISAMRQEMEALRSALAASRSESTAAFKELAARVEGSERQLVDLVRRDPSSALPQQMQYEVAEIRSLVTAATDRPERGERVISLG